MNVSRRILAVAVVFAALAGALGPATPASAALKRWKARVVAVNDGDTIHVTLSGKRYTVRFAGVNTMETGTCNAAEAKKLVQRMGVRKGSIVYLYASKASSMAANGRILRFVHNSRDKDIGARLLGRGLAMPYPSEKEPSRNARYVKLARRAAAKKLNIYNPADCRRGPRQGLKLGMRLMWDANLADDKDPNGEYVVVTNPSARALPLRGWVLRESSSFRYRFPRWAKIPARGSVTVHTGKLPAGKSQGWSDPATPQDKHFHWGWGRSIFGSERINGRVLGDGAYLFDPHGDIRSYAEYPCLGRGACTAEPLGASVSLHVHYAGTSFGKEWVEVTNTNTSANVDLTDYMLHSGGWTYDIAANTTLAPREKLRVCMGTPSTCTQPFAGQQQYWGNTGTKQSFRNYGSLSLRRISPANGRGVTGHTAKTFKW